MVADSFTPSGRMYVISWLVTPANTGAGSVNCVTARGAILRTKSRTK